LNSYFFEICKSSTGIALGMQCIPTMVRFLVFGAPIWMGVIFIVAPLWGGFFGLIGTRIAFGYFSKRVKDVKISKVLVF
jgi:hypothetical protein